MICVLEALTISNVFVWFVINVMAYLLPHVTHVHNYKNCLFLTYHYNHNNQHEASSTSATLQQAQVPCLPAELQAVCRSEDNSVQSHSRNCFHFAVARLPAERFQMAQQLTRRCLSSRASAHQRPRPSVKCQAQSVIRCPFAIAQPAGKVKPSPLDMTDSPNTVGANFWLAAGKPGQDVPGKLVSGIHRLYEVSKG